MPQNTLYLLVIWLHFAQKVVGEIPFLLHWICLRIKKHFLRNFKKLCQEFQFSSFINIFYFNH